MTDERYLFVSDSREKKTIARGAAHRKGGSKSKKCTLPSDYLTEKQRKELNGAVESFDLKKFYTWAEFKALPADIQIEWMNHMTEKYSVGYSKIAEVVFHVYPSQVKSWLTKIGVVTLLKTKKAGCSREALQGAERLKADCAAAQEVGKQDDGKQDDTDDLIDVIADGHGIPATKPVQDTPITAARLELNRFDLDAFKILANMFAGKDVSVRIEVTEQWGKTNG